MPKLVFSILCHDVIIDRESNSTSYIRALESGFAASLPTTFPPMYLGTVWEVDPEIDGDFDVLLQVEAPSGQRTDIGGQKIQPGAGAGMHKVNFRLPGLQIKEQGRHAVRLLLGDGGELEPVSELPLFVFLRQGGQ